MWLTGVSPTLVQRGIEAGGHLKFPLWQLWDPIILTSTAVLAPSEIILTLIMRLMIPLTALWLSFLGVTHQTLPVVWSYDGVGHGEFGSPA